MPPRPDYEPRKVFTLSPEGGYSLARNVAGNIQGGPAQSGGVIPYTELSAKCSADSSLPCHRIAVWIKSNAPNVTADGIAEWCLLNAYDKNGKPLMAPLTLMGCGTSVGATGGQAGGCVEVARFDMIYSAYDVVLLAGWKGISDQAGFVGSGSGPLVTMGSPTSNQNLKYVTVNFMRPEWITVFGQLDYVTMTCPAGTYTATSGIGNEWYRGIAIWIESFAWPN